MSTLRKLKRSKLGSRKRFEHVALESLAPARKMSEVLLEFAEPLLDGSEDGEQFGAAIALAGLCWNLSLMPPDEQEAELHNIVKQVGERQAFWGRGIREIVLTLVDRKKALFADDNRLVLNYKFVEEKTGPRLLVASAPFTDGRQQGHQILVPSDGSHPSADI